MDGDGFPAYLPCHLLPPCQGRPVGRDHTEQTELDIENEMRTFFRHYFTHSRYLSSTTAPLDALNLHNQGVDLDRHVAQCLAATTCTAPHACCWV